MQPKIIKIYLKLFDARLLLSYQLKSPKSIQSQPTPIFRPNTKKIQLHELIFKIIRRLFIYICMSWEKAGAILRKKSKNFKFYLYLFGRYLFIFDYTCNKRKIYYTYIVIHCILLPTNCNTSK